MCVCVSVCSLSANREILALVPEPPLHMGKHGSCPMRLHGKETGAYHTRWCTGYGSDVFFVRLCVYL